jgi:hypothetical protein
MDKLVFERSEPDESLIPVGDLGWDVDRRR